MKIRNLFFALSFTALISCSHDSPTTPITTGACSDVSGTYDVTYQGAACNTNQYLNEWVVVQDGCAIRLNINPDAPSVSGSVKGNTVHLMMRNGFINCTYQLEGDGPFDGKTIRASVSGPVDGPCCAAKQESLTVIAVRRTAGS